MKVNTDSHKLIYHPERVTEWLKSGDCSPIYVEIGLTNRCNHRCIFCALDWLERRPVFIDADILMERLSEMHQFGVKSVMFAGEGEPLLHPRSADIIEHAHFAGHDVSVATNGVLLNSKIAERILPCLSWIRFSLDAASPESHYMIHQGKESDFDTVVTNIKNAVKIKKQYHLPVTIGIQLLIIPENLHEIVSFTNLFAESGVDNVQIKPYSQHPLSKNCFTINPESLVMLEKEVQSYERDDFQVIFRTGTIERIVDERNYQQCLGLPFYALIEADGSVIPCNLFHENRDYTYGNIVECSFQDVWEGVIRRNVIEKLHEEGIKNCREVCRLDPANRYLHILKNPHPHVNFI